ncbi:MAG TPA: ABC transporter permease subunit [Verrucomicrobiae bacterium]|nr:ABC transporter permease subunit [Verrucomicrobiae bacterium]
MTAANHSWRQFKDVLMQAVTLACAILVVTPLVLVFYHIVREGIGAINWAFFTQLPPGPGESGGGMANAIVGTLILMVLAPIVGVPVGVLGGVFLSEYGGSRLNWWIRFTADVLNGVPSITWGLVVYGLMVVALAAPFHGTVQSVDTTKQLVTVQDQAGTSHTFEVNANTRLDLGGKNQLDALSPGSDVLIWYHEIQGDRVADHVSPVSLWGLFVAALIRLHNSVSGFTTLAGGVVLGFMMIPLVMRTTEEVLQLVPAGYREASLALGISKWRTIVQIVIRTALKGIVTGVLLALARVAGETAPLIFTAFGNSGWAHKLTEPTEALPLQIYVFAIGPYPNWWHQAWAGALILLLMVLFVNIGVRFLTRDRFKNKI